MDLLHPLTGGALRSNIPYKLMSINELREEKKTYRVEKGETTFNILFSDDLTGKHADDISGKETQTGPKYAILLTNVADQNGGNEKQSIAEFSNDQLKNVIGISWIAAMKLMGEYDAINKLNTTEKQYIKTFAQKFFTFSTADDNTKDEAKYKTDNEVNNKATIIAFIHGVQAYALYNNSTIKNLSLDKSLFDRYNAVLEYLFYEQNKKNVNNIWTALLVFYVNQPEGTDPSEDVYEILKNIEKVQNFLMQKLKPKAYADSGSVAGTATEEQSVVADDLSEVARFMSIHDVLFQFKK